MDECAMSVPSKFVHAGCIAVGCRAAVVECGDAIRLRGHFVTPIITGQTCLEQQLPDEIMRVGKLLPHLGQVGGAMPAIAQYQAIRARRERPLHCLAA